MESRKIINRIVIGLICFSLLVLIGLSIYQHMLVKNISPSENLESILNKEPAEIVSSETGDTDQNVTKESTSPSVQKQQQIIGDIEALEAQLDATEQELDEAHQHLADEAARKEELKQKQLELQKQFASDPSLKRYIRASLDTQYKDLFDELNLSPEELEKFKDILADQLFGINELSPEIMSASTDEQKKDLQQRYDTIREESELKIRELLGDDGLEKYQEYTEMSDTRYFINGFKESLSQDNQLTEEQEKALTEIMHNEERKVFSEIGYDPNKIIEFRSDINEGKVEGILKNTEKIHLRTIEGAKGTLSDSQMEQLKAYLKNYREMMEMSYELSNQ